MSCIRHSGLSRLISFPLHLPLFKVPQANILNPNLPVLSVRISSWVLGVFLVPFWCPGGFHAANWSQTLDTIRDQAASLAVVLKPDYRCLRANLSRSVCVVSGR